MEEKLDYQYFKHDSKARPGQARLRDMALAKLRELELDRDHLIIRHVAGDPEGVAALQKNYDQHRMVVRDLLKVSVSRHAARDRWVEETKAQQRIAKLAVSSDEVLRQDYELMIEKRKKRAAERKQNMSDLGLISDAINPKDRITELGPLSDAIKQFGADRRRDPLEDPRITHQNRLNVIDNCLCFFASVIKSGEPFTEQCQKDFSAARAAVAQLRDTAI